MPQEARGEPIEPKQQSPIRYQPKQQSPIRYRPHSEILDRPAGEAIPAHGALAHGV